MEPTVQNEQLSHQSNSSIQPAGNGWRTFGIVAITMAITIAVGYWLVTRVLFPTSFSPVTLSQNEQQRLDKKLERLTGSGAQSGSKSGSITAEPYTEVGASREIHFSEKELNALIANDKNLASKLAINLSNNLASAKLLIDLDPEFPLLGGKTLKVTAGMELSLRKGQPSAVLKGVSVWGVPIPNAWLGYSKNIDLFKEFGDAGGFWQTVHEGVDKIEVKDGQLSITLKE